MKEKLFKFSSFMSYQRTIGMPKKFILFSSLNADDKLDKVLFAAAMIEHAFVQNKRQTNRLFSMYELITPLPHRHKYKIIFQTGIVSFVMQRKISNRFRMLQLRKIINQMEWKILRKYYANACSHRNYCF